jgi:hypothetical protein
MARNKLYRGLVSREDFVLVRNAALLAACSVVILTFFGRGSVLHVVTVFDINLWVGVPLLILSAAAWVVSNLPYWDRFLHIAKMMFLAVGLLAFQLLSIPAGQMVLARDVQKAQLYCEALVPQLDEFKQKQGVYPKLQEEIVKAPEDLPRLLRSDRFYWRNGKVFTFAFKDPAGISNFYEFDSAKRKWERLG